MFTCCLTGWGRAACLLDNLNHIALGRFKARAVCRVHTWAVNRAADRWNDQNPDP